MVTAGRSGGPMPSTLMEAHEVLTRIRPSQDASRQKWLEYYRRSASVYAEMAEIDRGHHHEALYWAGRERAKATKLQREISKSPDGSVQTGQ